MKKPREWVRDCPQCNEKLTYSSYKNLWRANNYKKLCVKCTPHGERCESSEFFRNCPKCTIIVYYKTREGLRKALRKNPLCISCVQVVPSTGRFHSQEAKDKISKNHAKYWEGTTGYWMGKPRSEEMKRKLRKSLAERFGGSNFNTIACEFFDFINERMGWDGQHALRGGEFYVRDMGYFVDYYEPSLNLVIEYDEAPHEKASHKKKDLVRQKNIIDALNCAFVRIKETDSNGVVWSKLQEVINGREY